MLLMWRQRHDGGPDVGIPLPPLLPLARSAESTVESRGKGNGLESGQILTHADL